MCVSILFAARIRKTLCPSALVSLCVEVLEFDVVVAESWLLPHRDTSHKQWRGSVSIEVTEKIVAKYLLESQLLII